MTRPDPLPDRIYKIASQDVMNAAERSGTFTGMPIDAEDGYIHFSTAAQLSETLSLHFRGQSDLALFAVETAAMGEALKWEPSRGGALFPHVYGSFGTDRIVWRGTASVAADGTVTLPEGVK